MTFKHERAEAVETAKKIDGAKVAKITGKVLIYAVLILYALWVIFPFLVIVITSLTPQTELEGSIKFIWFPEQISFDAYRIVLVDDIYAELLYGDNAYHACRVVRFGTKRVCVCKNSLPR